MKTLVRSFRVAAACAFGAFAPGLHAQYSHSYTNAEVNSSAVDLTASGGSATLTTGNGVSATQSGDISGTGTVYKDGAGTLTLSGTNTYDGSTWIFNGTLALGADNAIPFTTGRLIYNSATLALGTYSNAVDRLQMDTGSITGTTGILSATTSFRISGGLNSDATVSAILGGTGSFIKNDRYNVILTGENTYTGGTQIQDGVLYIGNGGTTGSIVGNVSVGGSLVFKHSDAIEFTGAISGAGRLQNVGTGTVTLSGANTFTGAVEPSNGGGFALGSDLTTINYVQATNADFAIGSHAATMNRLLLNHSTVSGTTGILTTSGDIVCFSSATVSAQLAGTATLAMSGTGTFILSGFNSYTGTTTVNSGTLVVNGSIGTASIVTVKNNGTLGGGGTIGGATTIQSGGTLAPGNSPGLLTFDSTLTLASGATSVFQIDGTNRGFTYDAVDVAGLTTFGGTLALDFGSTIADGNVLNLFGGAGDLTGDFASVVATGSYTGTFAEINGMWSLSSGGQTLNFAASTGNLAFGVSAIPEPSTYAALAGLAALGLAGYRRRRCLA